MTLTVLQGGNGIVEEPAWSMLIPERADGCHDRLCDLAHAEWQRLERAMRAAETLAPENRHALQRLVLACVRYDVAAAEVMRAGAVMSAHRSGVPILSLWQVEMRAASSDAMALERELCLSPRRRGSATKVARRRRTSPLASAYLDRPEP